VLAVSGKTRDYRIEELYEKADKKSINCTSTVYTPGTKNTPIVWLSVPIGLHQQWCNIMIFYWTYIYSNAESQPVLQVSTQSSDTKPQDQYSTAWL